MKMDCNITKIKNNNDEVIIEATLISNKPKMHFSKTGR